jgi:hypothetical protein
VKKGIDTERKSSNNILNRAGEKWEEKGSKVTLKKKSSYVFLLAFYSLTRHLIYFAVEKKKKSVTLASKSLKMLLVAKLSCFGFFFFFKRL